MRWGRRDLHEHHDFLSPSLDGGLSRSIDFKQHDSFSFKEILQADPSKPLSRRGMQELGARGTMNLIMLVNKNTVAAGA